jgi:hypothetical protein
VVYTAVTKYVFTVYLQISFDLIFCTMLSFDFIVQAEFVVYF